MNSLQSTKSEAEVKTKSETHQSKPAVSESKGSGLPNIRKVASSSAPDPKKATGS